MLARRHIGVEPHQIGERHAPLSENRGDRGETQARLSLHIGGCDAVFADAKLAGAEDQPCAGRNFDAVDVAGKGRMKAVRRQPAHQFSRRLGRRNFWTNACVTPKQGGVWRAACRRAACKGSIDFRIVFAIVEG
jgi:hypothetical protein